jgi:hypothetical protein
MWSRRVELVCGVLAGVLGLSALGIGLFAPLGTECVDTTAPGSQSSCFHASQVQMQGLLSLSFAITLFGGLALGIALFAAWHSLTRSLPALIVLWGCTVLLYFATLLALLSIGVLLVPADVFALAASIAGTVAARQPSPAHT